MLTSIPSAAGAPTQVVLPGSSVALNTVLYTVPVNRTFRGHIFSQGAQNSTLVINGLQLPVAGTSQTNPTVLPITLVAGTVVRNSSANNNYVLAGVEE